MVEQIRAGGTAPRAISLYEAVPQEYWEPAGVNSQGWEHAEARSKNAIRTGAAYLDDASIARRAAQRKLLRQGVREAQAEAAARAAKKGADERMLRQEQDAERRRWQAANGARDKRLQEQRDAWEAEGDRQREERRILASEWVCPLCKGRSPISRRDDGYQITCTFCGKTAWGSHSSFVEVLNR